MTLLVIALYLAVVLAIGGFAHRLFRGTGEDYFVATRSIGSFVLLMSLFGTHMTAFALLGASGEAYHRGIGVFALMASSSALVAPLAFFFLAPRVWELGKRNGYRTQVQLFSDRWGSDVLGLLLFVVLIGLLVPYLVIGVKGGGITLHEITGGQVPMWAGSFAMCAVVLIYVLAGGLRGTAWANTFQTLVFMILGAVTFAVITSKLGGLEAALARVAEVDVTLLMRGDRIGRTELLSYTAIPLSVAMFPHIFMHWLTARQARAFRVPIIGYPLCMVIVWIPSVLLGVIGAAEIPGLEGPQANSVLVRMIAEHAPGVLAGLLAAGVFAAVMSSLDSQTLAASSMFTHDIVRRFGVGERMTDRQQVMAGRLFVVLVLAITYAIALWTDRSIFRMGIWAFSGFSALTPIVVAALYWRRATRWGALASVVTTTALWSLFLRRSWTDPGYTPFGWEVQPVVVLLAASTLAMILGSLFTRPPAAERLARFFDD